MKNVKERQKIKYSKYNLLTDNFAKSNLDELMTASVYFEVIQLKTSKTMQVYITETEEGVQMFSQAEFTILNDLNKNIVKI